MRCQQLALGLTTPLPAVSDDVLRQTHDRLRLALPFEVVLRTPYLRDCLVRSALLAARRAQRPARTGRAA